MTLTNYGLKTNPRTDETYKLFVVFDKDISAREVTESFQQFLEEKLKQTYEKKDDSLRFEMQYSLFTEELDDNEETNIQTDYIILENLEYDLNFKQGKMIEIRRTFDCNHPKKTLDNYLLYLQEHSL